MSAYKMIPIAEEPCIERIPPLSPASESGNAGSGNSNPLNLPLQFVDAPIIRYSGASIMEEIQKLVVTVQSLEDELEVLNEALEYEDISLAPLQDPPMPSYATLDENRYLPSRIDSASITDDVRALQTQLADLEMDHAAMASGISSDFLSVNQDTVNLKGDIESLSNSLDLQDLKQRGDADRVYARISTFSIAVWKSIAEIEKKQKALVQDGDHLNSRIDAVRDSLWERVERLETADQDLEEDVSTDNIDFLGYGPCSMGLSCPTCLDSQPDDIETPWQDGPIPVMG